MAHEATTPSDSGSGSTSMGGRTGASASATSLARGKACLRCRKRKMRCDGAHPACAQCVRAHKADTCAYDDGRGKTRTQALRERIVRLEAELERLREGRGELAGAGGREESVFLMDPHAPPSTSAGSESTFGELDFVDFGADAFGEMDSASGMEIERPTTSLSDPSTSAGFSVEPLSYTSVDPYTGSGAGGVHRTRTIRPRDRLHTGGLREPKERPRPSSGVFGYSANHPLVQQAQGYGSPYQFQFQPRHSRDSSTGSPSPSPSMVGSVGGQGHGGTGASPYSSFTDPLSLDLSPFQSPDPAMFSAFTSTRVAYARDVDQEFGMGMGMSAETESTLVQLVLAHRDQVGLVLHPGRLLASLSSSSNPHSQTRHHPVLRDALALVGARLARRACGSPVVGEIAERVLSRRAQAGLGDAMRLSALPLPLSSSSSFERSQSHQEGSVSPQGRGQTLGQGNEVYAAPALDALQVHVLLARYLFAECRAGEARMHTAAAADLVLQLGLHQLRGSRPPSPSGQESGYEYESAPHSGMSGSSEAVAGTLRLPPPGDSIALGERVALFWAVFVLDRLVGAALGLPPCVADDECVETRVDTPWPEEVEEYEHIPMESIQGTATLRSFFLHQGLQPSGASSGGFAPFALLAKAAALYAACGRTSANWGLLSPASCAPAVFLASSSPAPVPGPEDPATAFARLENRLGRLASALLPAQQLGAALPEGERRRQVVLHTLVHAGVARLHVRLARAGVGASLEKCVRAARASAALVRAHVGETDYAVLDPVFGSCWAALAEVFSLEPIQAGAATPGSPASAWVPHDLGTLLAASARLQGASSAQGFSGMESNPGSGA